MVTTSTRDKIKTVRCIDFDCLLEFLGCSDRDRATPSPSSSLLTSIIVPFNICIIFILCKSIFSPRSLPTGEFSCAIDEADVSNSWEMDAAIGD